MLVRDEADQARYVVDRVLEYRESGVVLKQQAVLFRASHHSGPLEIELTRRNIPFVKFGGLKFRDRECISSRRASRSCPSPPITCGGEVNVADVRVTAQRLCDR